MASTLPLTASATPMTNWPVGLRWTLALVCLTVATAASAALVMKQLEVLGVSLPGCGEQSACGDLSRGFFGSVPGLGWPTAYLGFTYFLAMMFAWSRCWPGPPRGFCWLARLGALASLGLIIIILVEWKLCPYCITAHVANFGFWITLEYSARSTPTEESSMPSLVTFITSWIIVTTLLALGQAQADHFDSQAREANEADNVDAIVMATLGGGGDPLKEAAAQGTEDGRPDDGDGDSFAGPRTVVSNPSDFAGRYLYGPDNAPVQIVMVSDYQCPDCKHYEDQVWQVLQSRDDVSLSVRHFPFNEECNPYVKKTLHANACWAAKFAETAGILGGDDAFWKAHRMLFGRKGRFTQEDFPGMVGELGFDPRTFQTIMMGPAVDALVAEDVELGGRLGVFFTPMIFINGVELKWYQIPANLTFTVDAVAKGIASGQRDATIKAPPTKAIKYVEDWRDGRVRTIPDAMAISKGVQSAPHSIVIFADYTDPTTRELHERVEALRKIYPGIRYQMATFPKNPDCNPNIPDSYRDAFPSGCAAAKAAKAAAKLGGRDAHWKMVEFTLEAGLNVTVPEILAAAKQMGLNPDELLVTMESPEVEAQIKTEVMRGKSFGIRSVPAIYVDGKHIPRWLLDDEPIVERVVKLAVTGSE